MVLWRGPISQVHVHSRFSSLPGGTGRQAERAVSHGPTAGSELPGSAETLSRSQVGLTRECRLLAGRPLDPGVALGRHGCVGTGSPERPVPARLEPTINRIFKIKGRKESARKGNREKCVQRARPHSVTERIQLLMRGVGLRNLARGQSCSPARQEM